VTTGNWFSKTLNAVRRSPSASALALVLMLVVLESIPLEMLVWQPSTTPALVDQTLALEFAVLAFGAALVWYGTARPIESALRDNRHDLKALFTANPEAMAVYDLGGRIVRGNAASLALLRRPPEDLINAHFTTHVAPEHVAEAEAAFERATGGRRETFETVFLVGSRERLNVHCTLSPHIVDGRIAGVLGVARDATESVRARAIEDESAQRIADLAKLANDSTPNLSRIHAALALLCRRYSFEEAFVAEIEGNTSRVLAQETANPGDVAPVPVDVLRRVTGASGILEIGDFGASVRSFAGLAIGTGSGKRGILGLTSSYGRPAPLDAADSDFIRVVAALVTLALERGREMERAGQLAFHDTLTGLPNRLLVIERLSDILGSPKWRGMHFAVLYIDLEGFKELNDSFGHEVGDRILRLAAHRIADSISSLDLLARLGGDEFAVVQPLPDGDAHADQLARRIFESVSAPFTVDGREHRLGVSIGINVSSNAVSASAGSTLVQRAEEALYAAKSDTELRKAFTAKRALAS
jgi:diguanylate cyclase (GGDEF)-like protein/PAS domain S-box-containing protein